MPDDIDEVVYIDSKIDAMPSDASSSDIYRVLYGDPANAVGAAAIRRIAARGGRSDLATEAVGLLAEVFRRDQEVITGTPTSGDLRAGIIGLRRGDVVTNTHFVCVGAATSPTLLKLGLYSSEGVLLAATANTIAAVQSTGTKTVALETPYTVPDDAGYYLAFLCVHGGSPGILTSALGAAPAAINGFPIQNGAQSGLTDLPDPLVLSDDAFLHWLGCS